MLAALHDLNLAAASCDHVVLIDRGRVVERGRYDELLATGGRFAEIFAEQAG